MDFLFRYFTSVNTYEIVTVYFIVAFFINLLWEVLHSQLYTTCLEMPLERYIPVIIWASLKDAFFIVLFFLSTVVIYQNGGITSHASQLTIFTIIALVFSYLDEKISLQKGRWRYADSMYTLAGVGVSPLLELAVTGIITFCIVEHWIILPI